MSAYLKQDEPDTRNVLDSTAQGIIGKPLSRPEGLLKVTGTATYAAEYAIDNCLEGVLVTAPFAKGMVTLIEESSVSDMPGIVAVISDERMPPRAIQGTAGEAPITGVCKVDYWGQPIALVVAETFEQARDAAKHLAIEYASEEAVFDPQDVEPEPDDDPTRQGDLPAAMSDAGPFGRCRLYHRRPCQCGDGTPCGHRRVGRRHADHPCIVADAEL